ncbi:MAG: M15 family metallopeptidase [Treponema sp.]|jgi:hypothetical protein|nr:M15 family metallopeptidase [Treponema sp.]
MKKIAVLFIVLLLITGGIYAGGRRQAAPNPADVPANAELIIIESQSIPQAIEDIIIEPKIPKTESPEMLRAEKVMRSIASAYPDKVEQIEFRNEDWAILLKDTWYYYAEGKLLPEFLVEQADEFRRQPFYHYEKDLPPWKEPTPEMAARYNNWTANRVNITTRRSTHLYDAIWGISSRSEADAMMIRHTFLGKPLTVHKDILDKLILAENDIVTAAKTKPVIQRWINSINKIESYNWRNIAESQNRSNHSYGLAIDILPKSFGGKETYWLWTSQNKKTDWWSIPYNQRYHQPDEVIKIFEKHGFIWGGKWPEYDTMHFEYRPEILLYNGIEL